MELQTLRHWRTQCTEIRRPLTLVVSFFPSSSKDVRQKNASPRAVRKIRVDVGPSKWSCCQKKISSCFAESLYRKIYRDTVSLDEVALTPKLNTVTFSHWAEWQMSLTALILWFEFFCDLFWASAIIMLLDLTAAFTYTADQIVSRLQHTVGIKSTAPEWSRVCLSDRHRLSPVDFLRVQFLCQILFSFKKASLRSIFKK